MLGQMFRPAGEHNFRFSHVEYRHQDCRCTARPELSIASRTKAADVQSTNAGLQRRYRAM
jgi:hypothetical protein